MICKHCGKRLVVNSFYQHEGETFTALSPMAAAAPVQPFTFTTHMIEPIPDPNPLSAAVGNQIA